MSGAESAYGTAIALHHDAMSYVDGARALLSSGATVEASLQVQQLVAQLADQRNRLLTLGAQLQVPSPGLATSQQSHAGTNTADVSEAIARASNGIQRAAAAINAVQQLLTAPLLPSVPPFVRAGLVYGGWLLIGLLAQCGLLVATNGVDPAALLTSLCVVPLLAFLAGIVTLHLVGQPRTGVRFVYSWKLGVAICLVGMPVAWVFLITALALLRG